jgi:hypothetical protein
MTVRALAVDSLPAVEASQSPGEENEDLGRLEAT